ncbi:MAG TPA: hypothetical protein VJJ82_02705 [Candidatus Nanoarchaeia archaeon]|nr:hypothetical protein [Candidatus Nanoarchaeia archaeon]
MPIYPAHDLVFRLFTRDYSLTKKSSPNCSCQIMPIRAKLFEVEVKPYELE